MPPPTKEVVKFIKNNSCFNITYKFDWHPSAFKSLVFLNNWLQWNIIGYISDENEKHAIRNLRFQQRMLYLTDAAQGLRIRANRIPNGAQFKSHQSSRRCLNVRKWLRLVMSGHSPSPSILWNVIVHIKETCMWCFVWFGTICKIWKLWKTPMEECYF